MKNRLSRSLALFGMVFLMIGSLQAAPGLTRKVAARLVAEAEQVREKEIAVGPMQQVEQTLKRGIVATRGICVTFIATKVVENTRVRTVCYRTFFYDPEWGWYTYVVEKIRGGERIDIVSETIGRFELR